MPSDERGMGADAVKAGDTVWITDVNFRQNRAREAKVTRVGRKFFYVREGYKESRFSLKTMRPEDNYNHQHAYTPEAWAAKLASENAWSELRTYGVQLDYIRRDDVLAIHAALKPLIDAAADRLSTEQKETSR